MASRAQPYRVIPLTKGYVAIIDAADFRRVNKHKWHVHMSRGKRRGKAKAVGQPYARAKIKGRNVYLHRFITGAELPLQADHRNHQTLDCRKENLEVVTHEENQKRRRYLQKKPKATTWQTIVMTGCTSANDAARFARAVFERARLRA